MPAVLVTGSGMSVAASLLHAVRVAAVVAVRAAAAAGSAKLLS